MTHLHYWIYIPDGNTKNKIDYLNAIYRNEQMFDGEWPLLNQGKIILNVKQ